MNKIFFIILFMLSNSIFGQLNEVALYLKQEAPDIYTKIETKANYDFKTHDDVIKEINKQSQAILELGELLDTVDKNIIYKYLDSWTIVIGNDFYTDYAEAVKEIRKLTKNKTWKTRTL